MPYRDIEARRAYGREWIGRNAEKAREAMRRWRSRHPQAHLDESHAFHARHREWRIAQQAEYRKRNPLVRRAMWQRRRARKAQAGGSFSAAEWLALVARYAERCAYCGSASSLEMDHRVPLARGGTNVIDNILPACGWCNRRKHTRTEHEFRAWLARRPRG